MKGLSKQNTNYFSENSFESGALYSTPPKKLSVNLDSVKELESEPKITVNEEGKLIKNNSKLTENTNDNTLQIYKNLIIFPKEKKEMSEEIIGKFAFT